MCEYQLSSVTQSCPTFCDPWTAAHQASLSITNSWSLLKLMSIALVMPSNHLILCCRLLLLPSIFPSIRVFSNESVLCIKWPKHWSFNFSISPSDEYSGLISSNPGLPPPGPLLSPLSMAAEGTHGETHQCLPPSPSAGKSPHRTIQDLLYCKDDTWCWDRGEGPGDWGPGRSQGRHPIPDMC